MGIPCLNTRNRYGLVRLTSTLRLRGEVPSTSLRPASTSIQDGPQRSGPGRGAHHGGVKKKIRVTSRSGVSGSLVFGLAGLTPIPDSSPWKHRSSYKRYKWDQCSGGSFLVNGSNSDKRELDKYQLDTQMIPRKNFGRNNILDLKCLH